jgi:hypothetical protein
VDTFLPAALSVEADDGMPETATQALWATDPDRVYSSRVIFHEAVHYWQQLSEGFLLRLVQEDWQRLTEYERSGRPLGPGPLRREFYREESDLGFSARDIHECLARFWEVVAFGPNRIMNDQWLSGMSVFHPDFVTANRPSSFQRKFDSMAPWGPDDFIQAMIMIGGEYAIPFLATGHKMPNASMLVFPWLAHYALQTRRPARVFLRFIEKVASELAATAREMLTRHSDPSDAYQYALANMAIPALLECLPIANGEDEQIHAALATHVSSDRATSPPIAWTFKRRIVPAVKLLAGSNTVLAAFRNQSQGSTKLPSIFAIQLLEGAMATPGLLDSRRLLLLTGIAPPCIFFSSGDLVSAPQQCRRDAREEHDKLRNVDPLANLLPFALDSARDREDDYLLSLSFETRSRWLSFMNAMKIVYPGMPEEPIE